MFSEKTKKTRKKKQRPKQVQLLQFRYFENYSFSPRVIHNSRFFSEGTVEMFSKCLSSTSIFSPPLLKWFSQNISVQRTSSKKWKSAWSFFFFFFSQINGRFIHYMTGPVVMITQEHLVLFSLKGSQWKSRRRSKERFGQHRFLFMYLGLLDNWIFAKGKKCGGGWGVTRARSAMLVQNHIYVWAKMLLACHGNMTHTFNMCTCIDLCIAHKKVNENVTKINVEQQTIFKKNDCKCIELNIKIQLICSHSFMRIRVPLSYHTLRTIPLVCWVDLHAHSHEKAALTEKNNKIKNGSASLSKQVGAEGNQTKRRHNSYSH